VPTHSEGGVDEHGAGCLEGWREELDTTLEQNRGMNVREAHDVSGPTRGH
jgi:hypothetical protein